MTLSRPLDRIRIAGRALGAAMVVAALFMTGCGGLPKKESKSWSQPEEPKKERSVSEWIGKDRPNL